MDLVTAPLTWTRIRGHGSGSPHPPQLLPTDWIMRTDDLVGSSYDAEKQIKSTSGVGAWGVLTQDTRANVLSPAF